MAGPGQWAVWGRYRMPPVVAIVGNSNSGKTRVAVSLVEKLAAEGYRIAAIKHCPHGYESDRPGSDTDRLYRAGAQTVIASSPGKRTRTERLEDDSRLEALVASLDDQVDMVIAEGFKESAVPKVLVLDGGAPPSVDNVIAVVSEMSASSDPPTYSFSTLGLLAAQLRVQFLETAQPPAAEDVSLVLDGVPVSLEAYPARVLAGVIRGFLSSLKDIPPGAEEVHITVRARPSGSSLYTLEADVTSNDAINTDWR